MVEQYYKDVEIIEKPGNNKKDQDWYKDMNGKTKIIEKKVKVDGKQEKQYKSMAKSIRGSLEGFRNKLLREEKEDVTYSAVELRVYMDEIIKKFNEFYPHNIVKNSIKILGGWKGEGTINIYNNGFSEDFIIEIPIKNKETSEVEWQRKEVSKEDVNKMIRIVKKLKIDEEMTCYEGAKELGYDEWKSLWRERKEYFNYWYYPVKILEALKIIDYSGKGTIKRLI